MVLARLSAIVISAAPVSALATRPAGALLTPSRRTIWGAISPTKVNGPITGVAMAVITATSAKREDSASGTRTPTPAATGVPRGRTASQREPSNATQRKISAAAHALAAIVMSTPPAEPAIQASKRTADGLPLAENTPTAASTSAVRATPASSIRSGAAGPRNAMLRTNTSAANDPAAAARPRLISEAAPPRARTMAAPMIAPALTPMISGLAIGFCVTRWRMYPPIARRPPAPAAPSVRGKRQGMISPNMLAGRMNQLPSGARPMSGRKHRQSRAPAARKAHTGAFRAGCGVRTGMLASTARSCGSRERSRERKTSSRGEPITAVTAPVGMKAPPSPPVT